MARRTLPLLYLNLGGEMMYVLDQRLMAQKIEGSKSVKVLDDIASTMFNRKFLEEIFMKHQALHSRRMLRAMFDKLAHASIMRLNENSMDKLYDLMIMAVKHQILMSKDPRDLVMITLNHLDAIMDYAKSPQVKKNVELAYELLIQSYCTLSVAEMQAIRFSMMNFLQGFKIRVSIFLQDRKQHIDGSFRIEPPSKMIPGVKYPGNITFFDSNGEILAEDSFPPGIKYLPPDHPGGLGLHETGNRGTRYGLNMYANSSVANVTVSDDGDPARDLSVPESNPGVTSQQLAKSSANAYAIEQPSSKGTLAKEELNLLAKLIGGGSAENSKDTFKLNLFDKQGAAIAEGEKEGLTEASMDTIRFDMKSQNRKKSAEISNVIAEMEAFGLVDGEKGDTEDLLDLMDKAN